MTLPTATLRTTPEDFVVEELPAYAASGRGEHLFVTFRKRGLTTAFAANALARAIGADPRGLGWAGMKDRHAVTTQTISLPYPMARGDGPAPESVTIPGLEVLAIARHDNKLKPGHLLGNRFRIRLRKLSEADAAQVEATLREVAKSGAPNLFGPQRFGRDGDNAERALAWVRGQARGPRDKREQRMLFSALQSAWFNELCEQRVADGSFRRVLPGDLAKKHDTGGLFPVPLEGPDLADAEARAEAGLISPTGPMLGSKMRWPEGVPGTWERALQERTGVSEARLSELSHLGEGTRRALRLMVADTEVTQEPGGLVVSFVLPKGGFATTVLAQACRIVDDSRAEPSEDEPQPE